MDTSVVADLGPDGRVTVSLDGPPQVRVEVDPLATAFTTLVELYGPLRHRTPPQVVARAKWLARDLPLPSLLRLLTDPVGAGLPDFFGLTESHGDLGFDERMEKLRATSPARISRDLTSYFCLPGARPVLYGDWLDKPDQTLGDVCKVLTRYWDEVVCQVYPEPVRQIAEQARRLEDLMARHGPFLAVAATNSPLYVSDRHVSMVFNDPKLISARPRLRRRGVVIKPMICAPITSVSNLLFDEETIVMATSTPLLSSWRSQSFMADVDVPLSGLLGVTRTRLIKVLTRRSATTTELADELDIALSTVSHHVGTLTRAGVVSTMRAGSSVRHHLTDRGFRLLQI